MLPPPPITATIQVSSDTNDLVVVNPCAFGKFIPAEVTMDTARLVANVANIESEDWARRYRFDQVLWNNAKHETSDLIQLAKSMGNDAVLRGENSVCLGVGGSNSGRTETMFGGEPTLSKNEYGLLGLTVAAVMEQLSEHAVCTLSLLEIVDEDVLRDLLAHDPVESHSRLKIRNVDAKGAIVQNLSDVPLDSMTGLDVSCLFLLTTYGCCYMSTTRFSHYWFLIFMQHLMRKAFHVNATQQRPRKHTGSSRGHVIATLKVWQNGVQLHLGNLARCSTILFADLASGEEGADATNTRRMASFRKSVSGLRGVLRSLQQQEHDEAASAAASYRECTLTRILQRPLLGGRTVVMATVSASTDSYERTLHTLNYIHRLSIRPGKTARSPFSPTDNGRSHKSPQVNDSPSPSALFDQYANNEAFLESMISDPRQRLAKVLRPQFSSLATPVKLELSDSEKEGYEPYDYMNIDPGAVNEVHSLEFPSKREMESTLQDSTAEKLGEDGTSNSITANGESQHSDAEFDVEYSDFDIDNGKQRVTTGTARKTRVSHAKLKGALESRENDKQKSGSVSGDWRTNQSKEAFGFGTDALQYKPVVSLSEESSTPPTRQKRGVIKSAPQHNPNEVEEWITSFEAEDDANTGKVAETAPTYGIGTMYSSEMFSEDENHDSDREITNGRSDSAAASMNNFEGSELDDTSVSQLEEAVNELAKELDELASSGTENEELSGTEHETMDANGFTPKAIWPELLEDDESALSLTSLHQDVGNTTDGKPQRKRDPDTSSLNERLAQVALSEIGFQAHAVAVDESKSLAAARPRGRSVPSSRHEQTSIQHRAIPSNAKHRPKASSLPSPALARTELNHTEVLSPSDECLGEIHTLEDAVDQIKRLHNGLWETSTLSLDRLRHAQMSQQRAIEEAVAAQRVAEAEADKLRKDLMRQSKESDDASRAYEEKRMEMESLLDKALTDRSDIEMIAEEAIAAQDRLERDVSRMKKSLETQREETDSAMAEYSRVVESRNELSKKLELATNSLIELQSKHSDCDVVIAELEATVDRLVAEAEELIEARDASEAQSAKLSVITVEQDRLKLEFEQSKEENVALCEENERLAVELRDYQAHFQKAEDLRTAHNEHLQAEHLAIQNELEMWQRKCREVEASGERAAQEYMEERAALLDELFDVKKQLVESNEAKENLATHRDEDTDLLTSEMHALQLERERDQKALKDTQQAFAKLRSDAKDKLKHLVKQKQAASATIEKLKDENAAHAESNRHLRSRLERAERGRESLQHRMTGLQERLEVEQLARREAEDRILQLESSPTMTEPEIQRDPTRTSRRWDPPLEESTEMPEIQMDRASMSRRSNSREEQYTEAELALLKEIEAEKASKDRGDGGFENVQTPLSDAVGELQRNWQRDDAGRYRRLWDATYGSPDTPGIVPVETFRAEYARRIQAEELVATMAAHAKEGLEKRNKEIVSLKLRLSSEANEKESEILSLRTQLHALRRESLS
jgi:hypothetical protein